MKYRMKFNPFYAVALLSVVVIAGCVVHTPDIACTTQDCFVQAANACTQSTYTASEPYGTIVFETSNNCTYTEKIVNINSNTPALKAVLENTSMDCIYYKGSFDADWIKYPVLSAMNCKGELRDALGALSLVYADTLVENTTA